jgi:hypothetical protein
MIKIPNQGQFSQPNNSDLFGNIWYTKNMNFDEEGYAKLSSRCVSFKSEKDDSAFDIPVSFGRDGLEFHIVTTDSPFDLSLTESNFSITEDINTDNPVLTVDSWGKWFQNRWHATTATEIWYTTGGAWTDTAVSLTSGKVHAMEVFRNKNTLAVSNGNTVLSLSTAYATNFTLTLLPDYEVIGLAYSNAKMGIVTMLSDTAAGQNQEAYFFTWDGATSSTGTQGFPMGSDTIMAIAAYKSSWVILTRTGELKYFNGGGFELLTALPFYFTNTTWADSQNRETLGDIMTVEGDVIYINVGNDLDIFGKTGESYLENYPAGVLCYDPRIGLYHRYSPSISPAYQITVQSGGVDTGTDIMTASAGTIPATGNPIKHIFDVTNLIGGVVNGKVYYIIKHSSSTFSLALTKELAIAGTKIDLTSANDAKFMALDVLDYGASKGLRSGGLAFMETRKQMADHLLIGSELFDYNSINDYATLCLTVPGFENRGYLVTAKVLSENVEDNTQKVYIKHRPLDIYDKIIVKYKDQDILGVPTSTPQFISANLCTWTDSNTFTTTNDLSAIKTYLDEDTERECEVEILSGAGAGQMAQISSITESLGTYTVNLAENVDGAVLNYKCDVLINNWKKLGEIDSTNTQGWEEFAVATSSKWVKAKLEVRGVDTTIEEFLIINDTQIPVV